MDLETFSKDQLYTSLLSFCRRGGAPVNFGRGGATRPKKVGGGAAWAVELSNLSYMFQKFFSKELLLSRYAR